MHINKAQTHNHVAITHMRTLMRTVFRTVCFIFAQNI